jgi:hypothetical protein
MFPDKPKQRTTHQSGRRDEAKDVLRDGQLHAVSKQGHPREDQNEPADAMRVQDRAHPVPDERGEG